LLRIAATIRGIGRLLEYHYEENAFLSSDRRLLSTFIPLLASSLDHAKPLTMRYEGTTVPLGTISKHRNSCLEITGCDMWLGVADPPS
jgi:hypothetical protein